MKKSFSIGVILFCTSLVHGDQLGVYQCAATDQGGGQLTISIDLDNNEIYSLPEGADAQDPDQWEPIFSSSPPTFCGYSPSVPQGTLCVYTSNRNSDPGQVHKNIMCRKRLEDGSIAMLTTGELRVNTVSLTGSLSCSTRGLAQKRLEFSNCAPL